MEKIAKHVYALDELKAFFNGVAHQEQLREMSEEDKDTFLINLYLGDAAKARDEFFNIMNSQVEGLYS